MKTLLRHILRTVSSRPAALVLPCILTLSALAPAAQDNTRPPRAPFEMPRPSKPANRIDTLVVADLKRHDLTPAHLCSDTVFIRRLYLDVTGSLPEPDDVRAFLDDQRPGKRAALIDRLLESESFADYMALKWGDILRVKAEFPINLWPNAVQAYHRWIHDALKNNMPYDEFARQLLTASGSNFRVPQVNFYRAIQGQQPSAIAGAVALTFMGVRIDNWDESKRLGLEAFFSKVAYKTTAEWKEQIVYLDPQSTEVVRAVFPDGSDVTIPPEIDPRHVFADWLIRPDNPWFAKTIVNRVWARLFGRGIIDPADDIRPDNPPVNPRLLAYLETRLVENRYDLRRLYRHILNSQTYQQSSIPIDASPDAEARFACYPVRQLDAEVLADALCWISGTHESYSSAIPEPFTFVPEEHRSVNLADASITSQFLEMFGRPPRDTGLSTERSNAPTDAQRLHMLNSTHIQDKIENSTRLRQILNTAKGNRRTLINTIYLNILSRFPTPAELSRAADYFQDNTLRSAATDLVWTLINTKEFLCRH